MFAFSAPLGLYYTGAWDLSTNRTLRITVRVAGSADPGVGTLRVTPRTSPYLVTQSVYMSYAANESSPPLNGRWDARPDAPRVLSFVAVDGGGDGDYGAGDKMVLTFSQAVRPVSVATRAGVDALLRCRSPLSGGVLAADYAGAWSADNTTLTVTVLQPLHDPGLGLLSCTLRASADLRSADGLSSPADGTFGPLTGTWSAYGAARAPLIVALVAADPLGRDDRYGAGDTVTVQFAAAVLAPPVATKAQVGVGAGRLLPVICALAEQ